MKEVDPGEAVLYSAVSWERPQEVGGVMAILKRVKSNEVSMV